MAGTGGANRSGGLTANGIPRNLLTVTVADGSTVVVPMISPTSIVTVGLCVAFGACGGPFHLVLSRVTDRYCGWPPEMAYAPVADGGAGGCPLYR